MLDAVECKLFGIGVEAMTVGSHEFYMGYAIRKVRSIAYVIIQRNIADKVSSVALSADELAARIASDEMGQRSRNSAK